MKVGLPALRAADPGGAVRMQLSGPLPPSGPPLYRGPRLLARRALSSRATALSRGVLSRYLVVVGTLLPRAPPVRSLAPSMAARRVSG